MSGNKNLMSIRTVLWAFAFIILSSLPAHAAKIQKIEIAGSQRVEPSTIAAYMDVRVGDTIDGYTTDRILKNLFATGLFADVAVEERGGIITVNIIENPVISEIAFEGNKNVTDEELLSEIQMRPRQVFTRTKVQSDTSRLYQIYRRQGRFSVSIEPKVIQRDQNRVDLVFEINEGDITKVESIRFVGNQNYDDSKLRSEISTKESAWYRFISNDDRYDPDRLAYDQELLRNFYLSQGYADFQVLSATAELSNDKKGFYITFTVEEGERYKVTGTEFVSAIESLDTSLLQDSVEVDVGDWYNADDVRDSISSITNTLGDMQYAFVNGSPDIRKNATERTIVVVFRIDETPKAFVERINFNGNIRTLDKVLRREMLIVEGDPFNRTKLSESERNLRNLDFFELVNVDVKGGSAPDKTVIDVDVQEKSTGELSIGAGFSSSDGPLADLRIRERNLLGKGQDLAFAATIAGERTEFDASFTEPYFLQRDISAGVDVFHITRDLQDESSFDQQRTGGGVRLGYPLSRNWRQTLGYRLENNEITDVDSDASRFIRDQEGKRTTSAVSQRLVYDTRDSGTFTTNGLIYWLDAEVSGLGGDSKYVSGKTGASYFIPLTDQFILNVLGETGAIQGYSDTDVEINERYFVGGSTLRGFERSGVGPRDVANGDALGGNFFYRSSVELSFPIGLPEEMGIRGHAFSDAGSLWDIDEEGVGLLEEDSLRAAGGIGLSWRSPFGPIRVDFAAPFLKEDFDEEENFRFDFGTRF